MSDLKSAARQALASGRPVRVKVAANVAYDLDRFTKSLRDIAEKLGHPACLSGLDFLFELERDWVINSAGEVRGAFQG